MSAVRGVGDTTSYRGRCAYCEYETQTYDLLERAEADLLSHAHDTHAHISNPRVMHLSEIERVARIEGA